MESPVEMEGLLLEQRYIYVFYFLLCQKTMKGALRKVEVVHGHLESLRKSQRVRRKVSGARFRR